ncbi:MAG: cation diffusion facilitator family transporter [Anaerolineales bacterium]|jgi:cation diffusion facilitator family transporter|nr:cation diffusion facilitator family transporter [Anaerolineales bacterium]
MSPQRNKKSLRAVNIGLATNILLAALKTGVGIVGNSPALLAEGINSTSDVAYYLVASVFVRLANKPADNEHPYGHRQLESIASVVVGSFVVATAIAVFWDAINKIWNLFSGGLNSYQGATPLALWVALFTVLLKVFLTIYIGRLGKETRNPVVQAMAYDHRNDLFSASAASLGIFLGQRGLPWVDPLAGALVALLILRTGIYILRESSVELMDAVPSKQLAVQIAEILLDIPGVKQVEEIQAHRFGPHLVLNLTIGVDGEMTIREGDEIANKVEFLLCRVVSDVRRVHVHYHPARKSRTGMGIDEILAESRRRVDEPEEPL